ncbi:unnamed protein product, partial [Bubo scandiacus]
MGSLISSEEKSVLSLMERLLAKCDAHINLHALKRLLKWVSGEIPGVDVVTIFTVPIWDEAGVRLWDCATGGNEVAAQLLPTRRTLFEIIKRKIMNADRLIRAPPACKRGVGGGSPGPPRGPPCRGVTACGRARHRTLAAPPPPLPKAAVFTEGADA